MCASVGALPRARVGSGGHVGCFSFDAQMLLFTILHLPDHCGVHFWSVGVAMLSSPHFWGPLSHREWLSGGWCVVAVAHDGGTDAQVQSSE
jgi:hypothetical protein